MEEHVVLVDEQNNVLGTMPKAVVHTDKTPLHRGFSLFLFNKKGRLLIQQRSHLKKTWPLMWSNSCCGHPMLEESNVEAAKRKLEFELGMEAELIKEITDYRYTFTKDNIMENEICPILAGITENKPRKNNEEVEAFAWVEWKEFLEDIKKEPEKYSPWCIEEAGILEKNKEMKKILEKQ